MPSWHIMAVKWLFLLLLLFYKSLSCFDKCQNYSDIYLLQEPWDQCPDIYSKCKYNLFLHAYAHTNVWAFLRKEDNDWVKKYVEHEVEGARPNGRPNKTWRLWKKTVRHKARKLNRDDAVDRNTWRK